MSGDDYTDSPGEAVAADLGRRLAAEQQGPVRVSVTDPGDSVHVYRVRDDEEVEVQDQERFLQFPRRARGGAVLDWPDSFAEYVTALHTDGTPTRMWADLDSRAVTAVLNDHADGATPGWRDLTIRYQALVDEDWRAWRGRDGKLSSQTSFGEFVEEHLHNIVKPDGPEYARYPTAAEMLDVAVTMTAKRNVEFDSSTRLQSGDVEFSFRETTAATAGRVQKFEVPERFMVQASPFVGHPPVLVQARLRYKADRDGFGIGYRLLRPDLTERQAFEEITAGISAGTPEDVPLLWGSAPDSLR